jgi:hypothetical protein
MIFKKKVGTYECLMLLLVVLASTLRLVLISQNWPVTNSDEAIMDLMALHINNRGEHPIFFYGQAYMGPIEAYIGALGFRLFGLSVFSVRLGLIPFFALFLIGTYFLTRKLYNRRLALFTVALLCLGSSDIFSRQLKAIGGYPEITFLGSFIFFLCSKLALSSYPHCAKQLNSQDSNHRQQRFRWLLYGFLGLLIGSSIWIDQLLLPYIVSALLLLCFFCRHEFFSQHALCLWLGIIIGASPLIYYNFTVPLSQNSLEVLLKAHGGGKQELMALPTPFLRQLSGTFLISLPTMTGFNPLCDISQFPPFSKTTSSSCIATQGAWSLGYLFLWICAFLMVGISLRRLWGHRRLLLRSTPPIPTIQLMETREQTIIHMGRLMLLIGAMLTLLQYLLSPAPGLTPNTSARYLECMLISTPAILWPLWSAISLHRDRKLSYLHLFRLHLLRLSCFCLLICIGSMFLVGTINILLDIPSAQRVYNREQALMQTLLQAGITHFYSEYWTCNHLIFRSDERLICSNLNGGLGADPVFDRYQPYRHSVRASHTTAYVFPQGSSQQQKMDRYLRSKHIHYTRRTFQDYVIYQMATPIGLP